MGSVPRAPAWPVPPELVSGVVDFRSTVVSKGFSALAIVTQDLLSGFERPSVAARSLNSWIWWSAPRELGSEQSWTTGL